MPKYNVDDTVFVFNLFKPLVAEFKIQGVMRAEEGMYYSCDGKNWVREDYLYETEGHAYFALIDQAEKEFGIIAPMAKASIECREESMVVNAEFSQAHSQINNHDPLPSSDNFTPPYPANRPL